MNERLARRMLESLKIWPLLRGYRGRPAVALNRLIETMIRLSYVVADHPEIKELDINPLLAGPSSVLALDARIAVDVTAEIREAKATMSTTELPHSWEEFKNLKRQIVEDLERRFLTAALDRCSQNVTHAAESVGMQRPNFHALMRHHGLKPDTSTHKDG